MTDAQVAEAVGLYRRGMNVRELADHYGITHPSVMLALKQAGVKMRKRGGHHRPRVGLPREAFPDPVWGTREFAEMMARAPR